MKCWTHPRPGGAHLRASVASLALSIILNYREDANSRELADREQQRVSRYGEWGGYGEWEHLILSHLPHTPYLSAGDTHLRRLGGLACARIFLLDRGTRTAEFKSADDIGWSGGAFRGSRIGTISDGPAASFPHLFSRARSNPIFFYRIYLSLLVNF